MANVYFWSDLHFGHRLVAGHRGFGEDTDAHDAALCERLSRVLRKDDQLWLLGDLALARAVEALGFLRWIRDETGAEMHLILGNHDKAHPLNRNSHKFLRQYLDVFASVQTMARRKIDGKSVMLSHFPYDGDHTLEHRYMQYRLRDEGLWLIHGHTHSKQVREGERQIHVGVDAWPDGPVPLSTIEAIIHAGELGR